MKKLKVLNKDMTSPFQGFKYEIGKEYVCEDFDTDIKNDCSNGFYATDIEGLPYSWNINRKVFEVKVSGKSVIIDPYKQRFEKQTVIREINKKELIILAKKEEERLGYKLSEVIFPINPLLIKRGEVTLKEIELLKKWASVRASVWVSVWDSVWDSVGAPVWASVWASVGDSVWASVGDSVRAPVWDSVWDSGWAYISSLFPNITKWKYIEHKEGINPFQAGIDLWKSGLVPSYDGKTWRLHSDRNAKIVYTLNQ